MRAGYNCGDLCRGTSRREVGALKNLGGAGKTAKGMRLIKLPAPEEKQGTLLQG